MKNFNKITFLLIFFISLGISRQVFAARVYFESYKDNIKDNGDFLVQVLLDTEGELVNAIDGTISIPKDSIDIKNVIDGDSSINFWIEKPIIKKDINEISFSGITPGGFFGKDKLILSFILHQDKSIKGAISFKQIKVLKNNGDGSEAKVKVTGLSLPISSSKNLSDIKTKIVDDKQIPEDFTPNILKDPALFDGKNVLVFATQDKDSGINHYEVREGYFGKFVVTESPYLLENQSMYNKIFIKAVDNSGNERLVVFYPSGSNYLYQLYIIIAIILSVYALLNFKKIWSKFIK